MSDTVLAEIVHNLVYAREPATADWIRDAMEHLKDHYGEVSKFKSVLKLDPNIGRYLELQRLGRLHLVTVRDGGRLRGYSSHFIFRHPHYDVRCAEDDVYYVVPPLRRLGVGKKLRQYALDGLKERGVKFVTARIPAGHEHDHLMMELGFSPLEMCWAREL